MVKDIGERLSESLVRVLKRYLRESDYAGIDLHVSCTRPGVGVEGRGASWYIEVSYEIRDWEELGCSDVVGGSGGVSSGSC